jgi:predicted transcriptional regulator
MKVPRVAQGAVKALEAGLRAAGLGQTNSLGAQTPAASKSKELAGKEEHEPGRALLISVKPVYANAILDGLKTVELRRTRPNLPDGSLVILYSSTPTRAVVGWAHLSGVRQGTPDEIWDAFGDAAAIAEPDYDIYFAGADQAFALELDDVVTASRPVPLEVIRSIGVQPPQSWRYLPPAVSSRIQESATT